MVVLSSKGTVTQDQNSLLCFFQGCSFAWRRIMGSCSFCKPAVPLSRMGTGKYCSTVQCTVRHTAKILSAGNVINIKTLHIRQVVISWWTLHIHYFSTYPFMTYLYVDDVLHRLRIIYLSTSCMETFSQLFFFLMILVTKKFFHKKYRTVWIGRDLNNHLVQNSWHKQGHLSADQVAQGPI